MHECQYYSETFLTSLFVHIFSNWTENTMKIVYFLTEECCRLELRNVLNNKWASWVILLGTQLGYELNAVPAFMALSSLVGEDC